MGKHVHEHEHSHGSEMSEVNPMNLFITMILNFIITAIEAIGGIYSGSLSLLSDALHNLSDGLSIIVSYVALKISKKGSNERKTFGYRRSGILAASLNSSVLIVISVFLFMEAYKKFVNPRPVDGATVVWVALIGVAANTAGVFLLHRSSEGNINLKSAYLHLLSDAMSSVAVIIGAVLMFYYRVYWIDPLLTVVIGIYVMKESIDILKSAINILMQGVPENIDVFEIAKEIEKIDGVKGVHHVHVWSLDEKNIMFESHVNVKDMPVSKTGEIYEKIEHLLCKRYNINHITVQFECGRCPEAGIIEQ